MRVYLAGGMRSGWQERVKAAVPGHVYIDPCSHQLTEPHEYTVWDLAGVRSSDVVFAYLEADNPSGFGLAVECGYARALGKIVVFVDEKSATDERMRRQLAIVREVADVAYDDLPSGLAFLARLCAIESPLSQCVSP